MKTMISILMLISINAFAGNGSGTLGMVSLNSNATKYVRFVGMDRADMVFEFGKVNSKNELNIIEYKARREEFKLEDSKLLNAIDESRDNKDWIEVK